MTDGRRQDAPSGLVGREELFGELLGLLGTDPRSVVLRGEAGSGKTALLDAVGRVVSRQGWSAVTASGRFADRQLPFATISALLTDPRAGRNRAQRRLHDELLAHIRGEDAARSKTPLGLRMDLLAWLEGLSAARPLLVLVDDAQWVDSTSLQVLAFLARRVGALSVSFLFATRNDRVLDDLVGLPVVTLTGLSTTAASELVRAADPAVTPDQLRAVLERSEGNPLALLEFTRALSTSPGLASASDVPRRIQEVFASDLPALPARTRSVLLTAAAGTEDLGVLARIAGEQVADALEPAERAGLVQVRDRTVRFRHPLIGQAVYAAATAAERVQAHRALAEVFAEDLDRRAWHRAAASLAPDEDVAEELTATAQRAIDRVAYPDAARALHRAAELSADAVARERRLMTFIRVALPTGRLGSHLDLYRQVRDETGDPIVRAQAQQYIAFALTQTMDQEAARLALEDAIAGPLVEDVVWPSLTSLAVLVYQTGGDAGGLLDRVRQLGRSDDEHPLVTASRLWVRAAAEPIARPTDLLTEVRTIAPLPPGSPPVLVGLRAMLVGSAAWLLDLPSLAGAQLREAVGLLQRANSQELLPTLVALAQVHADRVALDDAEDVARQLHEITDAEGLEYQRAVAQHTQAAVAALRGDGVTARRIADDVFARIDLASCVALEVGLHVAIADSWYGEDELARWSELRAVFAPDGSPLHGRLSVRALVPAVIAGRRSGHEAEAGRILDAVTSAIPVPAGAYQAMVLTTARAVLSDGSEAEALLRSVVDDVDHAQWAFEVAVARLELGRVLRGLRRQRDARGQLTRALQTFERLGTVAWASDARRELRDAGGVPVSAETGAWATLTPQERQVVRLAATGRTNREIGEALFLSPRTVSAHLYNAFPKLGVTTRRQLREVVDRLDR